MKLLATRISTWLVLATCMMKVVSGQQNTTSPCDAEMETFCATEANRYCYLSNETKPVCGNCFPGYVEWRARCVSEDKIDIVLYLEEYLPTYRSNLTQTERAELLMKAIQLIAQYQNQNPPPPFQLGLNAYSADSLEDIKSHLGFNAAAAANASAPVTFQSVPMVQGVPLPSKVDWVDEGIITSVKDQGRCGCCWAVSTVGAIEGAVALQSGFLQSLSFQQYISCDKDNNGCNGGSLVYALAYPIQETPGIATLSDYQFTDSGGTTTQQCDTTVPAAVGIKSGSYVVDFYDDLTFEERLQKMKEAVAKQPVSMVLKSGCQLFSNYKSGILTTDDGCECTEPTCADHAVLMVGYDDTSDPPSWKLKNSWGTGWGEDGYFRIAQTQKGDYGLFGILTHGVVPEMAFNMTASSTVTESTSTSQGDDSALSWWAWLLILLAAIAILFFAFSCCTGFLCPRKKR